MVAVFELLADILQREIREGPHEVHGHLAGHGGVFRAALAADLAFGDAEVAARLRDDDLGRGDIYAGTDNVFDGALDARDVDGAVHDLAVGRQAIHDAFDLADVRRDVFGYVIDDFIRKYEAQPLRLVADDGHAGLDIGRLDIHDEAAPMSFGGRSDVSTIWWPAS